MALFDSPPHAISLFTATSSRDAGGGTTTTYTAGQAGIPASINLASASEQELFASLNIVVTHTVALLSSALTAAVTRGMKATDSAGHSYHVEGIRTGRAYAGVPAFTYLQVREIL